MLAAASLSLLATGALLTGCAVDATEGAPDEEAAATEAEVSIATRSLVGAYRGAGATSFPAVEGLVLQADGRFFADRDRGLRCFRAPCPSHEHVEGTFRATRTTLTLTLEGTVETYRYEQRGEDLVLTARGGLKNVQKLSRATSYCGLPMDCAGQALIHPMCVGSWTCSEERACAYSCGIAAEVVWPARATKLVANQAGGGFRPPPPAGSECNGGETYTLDVVTRELSWKICSFSTTEPQRWETGARKLTTTELRSVHAAMGDVKVTTEEICGADKPYETLKVTTAAGEKTYVDSFYACQGGENTYVDGIGAPFHALRELAH